MHGEGFFGFVLPKFVMNINRVGNNRQVARQQLIAGSCLTLATEASGEARRDGRRLKF